MNIIRKTEWSTDYAGTEFRILVIDACTGSRRVECHHIQYKNATVARCMNSLANIDVPVNFDITTPRTIEDDTKTVKRIPAAVFSHAKSSDKSARD